MRYLASQIDPEQGLRVEKSLPVSDLNALVRDVDDLEALEPMSVDLAIKHHRGRLHLSGHISTTLALPCRRCLEPVPQAYPIELNLWLLPESTAMSATAATELELQEDDLDTVFFDGENIDLSHILKECILLEVDPYPLCAESCAGLCPGCGSNRNHQTCQCPAQPDDSPWDALKSLKSNRGAN